jgi:hypothetical protein
MRLVPFFQRFDFFAIQFHLKRFDRFLKVMLRSPV